MPIRAPGQHIGDVGVASVQKIVEKDLAWIFREQAKDFGIDAQVEVVDSGRPTGRLLALQIKAGPSFLDEKTAEGFVFREDLDHLEYWVRHSLAVIVVLYDPGTDRAWWAHVDAAKVERTGKTFKLIIPFLSVLDWHATRLLARIADAPKPLQRLRALWMARPFLVALKSGGSVRLKIFVKTNTVTPRAWITVALKQQPAAPDEQLLGPWFVLWPGAEEGLKNVASLIPWASLKRDHDEEEEKREWLIEDLHDQQEGQYAEGELIGHETKYGAFAAGYAAMSYWQIVEATSVEGYDAEFDLELSSLGKAFLTVDGFLSS